jgi:hypothetical protein
MRFGNKPLWMICGGAVLTGDDDNSSDVLVIFGITGDWRAR